MDHRDSALTRREFLERSLGGAMAATLAASSGPTRPVTTTQSRPGSQPTTGSASRPVGFGPGAAFAKVVEVKHSRVFRGSRVSTQALREMLEATLLELTGQSTTALAWRSLLRADDVIGLKFNQVGDSVLGTNKRLGMVLVASLIKAEFDPSRIVLIELPDQATQELATAPMKQGWQSDPVAFGGTQDHLAAVLDQVTAIINVPALKVHRIAGMAGALKNISHAMVRHPARYHDNGCDPWIAAINALPEIRGKIRLHLCSAMRVVYEQGPEATPANVTEAVTMLGSTDPVAVDAVGWEILRAVRKAKGLPPLLAPPARPSYLATAEKLNLGVADLDVIDRRTRVLA